MTYDEHLKKLARFEKWFKFFVFRNQEFIDKMQIIYDRINHTSC